MSPEQARGQRVDKRTDIWAFGCLLFEMLTGRTAFERETVTDTLAAIVDREPDGTALPATVLENIRRLLRRCLQKDPARRVHDIADAGIEIDDATTSRSLDNSTNGPGVSRARASALGSGARHRDRRDSDELVIQWPGDRATRGPLRDHHAADNGRFLIGGVAKWANARLCGKLRRQISAMGAGDGRDRITTAARYRQRVVALLVAG